jgi:hypothetical protein
MKYPSIIAESVPGAEITLGPWKCVVPPLKLIDLKAVLQDGTIQKMGMAERFSAAKPEEFAEGLSALYHVMLLSLKRNYPEITEEILEEVIDVRNANSVIEAVMGANNLEVTSRPTDAVVATAKTK